MSHTAFDELESRLAERGIDGVFEHLVEQLTAEKKYHELFDVLLMRSAAAAGAAGGADDVARRAGRAAARAGRRGLSGRLPRRGQLLLADGQLREAWMYLRPVGEQGADGRRR